MFTIMKKFRIETAHVLNPGAYTKDCCDTIHGHSYEIGVFLRCQTCNAHGVVLDFGELKAKVKPWLDRFDHGLIIPAQRWEGWSREVQKFMREENRKLIFFPCDPTAEAMARDLFEFIKGLGQPFEGLLWKVRVKETESAWAEYEIERSLI